MRVNASLIAGVQSIVLGTIIGMALPTVLMIALLSDDFTSSPGDTIGIILAPFGIGLLASAIGLLVIGGPVTAWLSRRKEESWRAYFVSGLIGGLVPITVLMWIVSGALIGALFFGAFGALTGAGVGHFWWVLGRKRAVLQNTEAIAEIFE